MIPVHIKGTQKSHHLINHLPIYPFHSLINVFSDIMTLWRPLGSSSVFVRYLPRRSITPSCLLHLSFSGRRGCLGVVSPLLVQYQLTNNILLSVCQPGSSQLTNNFGLNSGNLFVLFVFMSSRLPTLLLLGQSTHLFMALSSVLFWHLPVYVSSTVKSN